MVYEVVFADLASLSLTHTCGPHLSSPTSCLLSFSPFSTMLTTLCFSLPSRCRRSLHRRPVKQLNFLLLFFPLPHLPLAQPAVLATRHCAASSRPMPLPTPLRPPHDHASRHTPAPRSRAASRRLPCGRALPPALLPLLPSQ